MSLGLLERKATGPIEIHKQELLALRPQIKRTARRLTRDTEKARNLVQDAFLKALRYLDSYRDEGRMIEWFYSVLRSVFINQYYKDKRELADNYDPLFFEEKSRAEDKRNIDFFFLTNQDPLEVVRDYLSDEVYLTLKSIPKYYRDALLLNGLFGKEYWEIAGYQKTPIGTTKSRISRAKEHFKKRYNHKNHLVGA